MYSISKRHLLVALLIGFAVPIFHLSASAQDSPSPEALLARLQQADQTVLDGNTLESIVTNPDTRAWPDHPDSEQLVYVSRLMKSGDTWAVKGVLHESVAAPKYQSGLSGINYGNGGLSVHRTQEYLRFNSPQFTGMFVDSIHYKVAPSGEVGTFWSEQNQTGHVPIVWLDDPKHPVAERQIFVPLLASGYGYSYLIDRITEIEARGDRLLVGAEGRLLHGAPAVWELEIEDGPVPVVRGAAAYPIGYTAKQSSFEVSNTGTLRFDAGMLPETGTFSFAEDITWSVRFRRIEKGVSKDIIAETEEKLVRDSYPPGTDIRDRRGRESGFDRTIVSYDEP